MNWMKWRRLYYGISVSFLVLAIIPLTLGKLQPAIEFTGGSRLVVSSQAQNFTTALETALEEKKHRS
ncbi:hypothetical protein LRY64_03830 [Candidatus Woesebacteria bacterium]|nr:hypothetical protein [Candidatus Woesebacteria bacterium]